MSIHCKITITIFWNSQKIILMLTNVHLKVLRFLLFIKDCCLPKNVFTTYSYYTGTIIATLKRKSKSLEKIPMYEMVSFHRGSTIPTSHIHMYDPDNITIAISIFRVSRFNLSLFYNIVLNINTYSDDIK